MKAIYILILLMLFEINITYSQNWHWVKGIGGIMNDNPITQMLCMDSEGNTYHSGVFNSDPCYFGSDTLSPLGVYDFYIAKYDANGNEIWVRKYGGLNSTSAQQEGLLSMCYSESQNTILFSGGFYGSIIFGNDTLFGSPTGGFKGSIDTSGSINWIKSGAALLGTEGDGYFFAENTYSLPGTIDTIQVTPGVWISKHTIQGQILWAQKIFNYNGNSFDAVHSRFKVYNGKIFGIGSCDTDTFTVDTITVYANYASDQYFISCFDTSGSALWIKPCSGINSHQISEIEVDDEGASYITGPFNNSAIFGQDTINAGFQDLFLAKYDVSGNFRWVHTTHSNSSTGFDLAIGSENSIYLLGRTTDTAIVCNDTLIATAADLKYFIVRYDSSGTCIALSEFSSDVGLNSIACANSGRLIIVGSFRNNVNLGGHNITSHGAIDVFIANCDAITGTSEVGPRNHDQLIIFANPNEGRCNISVPEEFINEKKLFLSIYNIKGEIIQQGTLKMSEKKIQISLEAEAKGVYSVILSNGKKNFRGKIVFE